MITGLNHLTLAVSDLDRSFDFYVELLGCRAEARWRTGAYLSAGNLWLCLSLDRAMPARDYTHVAFSVMPGTFEASVERLEAAGARCWKRNTSAGESFYFLDPDGHRLELHEGNLASRLATVDRAPYADWVRFDVDGGPSVSSGPPAIPSNDTRTRSRPRPRLANVTDVPMLERCARAAYIGYVARLGREPAPMRTDFAAAVAQERVRVIERDGQLAGYVIIERGATELHLENVAVFPERAGAGLGRTLISSVENEARWLGLDRVTLYTNALMHENLSLYARLGYAETDRRTEHGFDRVFLEKRVLPGSVAGSV